LTHEPGHREILTTTRRSVRAGLVDTPDGRRLTTASGIPLAPIYTDEDWSRELEPPGAFPFTRGISAEMYRKELWHADLYAGFGNAEDARGRYEFLLNQGAAGVNIALDLPTQLGLDSDDPLARGEVGKVGLAVDTLRDVEDVFRDTPLDRAGIVFTVANAIGPLAAAWFVALGDRQGVSPQDYVVHLQNDPLKEFTGRGTYVFPIEPSIKLACDVIEFAVRRSLRHWKPIGICGSQYRWGGGTAVHEIAYGICQAFPFIDELLGRGLGIDEFAPLLELHLSADIDLFEEVAKFRAARRVWARLLKERYGPADEQSMQLRISLYTGGWRLTKQEPLNNSVRIAIQALAAVLGGVQHLGMLSIDEALSTPSEEAVKLAVRTHQILAYEARAGHVVDPLGGSHLVEALTDELEHEILTEIERVEGQGGVVAAIRNRYLQDTIDEAAYTYARAVDVGEEVVVGVNRFVDDRPFGSESVQPFRGDKTSEERQLGRLRAIREERSERDVRPALDALTAATAAGENVMPTLIEAVRAYATVGEVCRAIAAVVGTYEIEEIAL
jgi:methylmalonyl-CoA mutase N-terminal domain/subunit